MDFLRICISFKAKLKEILPKLTFSVFIFGQHSIPKSRFSRWARSIFDKNDLDIF